MLSSIDHTRWQLIQPKMSMWLMWIHQLRKAGAYSLLWVVDFDMERMLGVLELLAESWFVDTKKKRGRRTPRCRFRYRRSGYQFPPAVQLSVGPPRFAKGLQDSLIFSSNK